MAGEIESAPEPDPAPEPLPPRRRRTFTIGGMMTLVLGFAGLLGGLIAQHRAHRRADAAMLRGSMLVQRVQEDTPGHPTIRTIVGHGEFHWLGVHRVETWLMSSPTGPDLMVVVDVRASLFDDGPDLVRFESGGRSATRPLSEFDPDRPVDLAAILSGSGF